MAKNSITDYSKTAASNTDIQSVDIAEGCLPSGINNAIREIMADLADINDGTVTLTSPSFAAASLTGDLSFGDGNKAIFGDNVNGDLVIQHDGTDSKIVDRGTGELLIQGSSSIRLQNFTGTQDYFVGVNNGASTIYHSGSAKLATTSTGIDVTGTVTADGLSLGTSSPDATLQVGALNSVGSNRGAVSIKTEASDATIGESAIYIEEQSGAEGYYIGVESSGGLFFSNSGQTTPTLFLDDSNNVGIGTSSPDMGIHLSSGGTNYLRVTNTSTGVGSDFGTSSTGTEIINRQAAPIRFQTNATERMRIDSSGNVGIGTSSPSAVLHTKASGQLLRLETTQAIGSGYLSIYDSSALKAHVGYLGGADDDFSIYNGENSNTKFFTNATERMRIDSSGNVGIGNSSPDTNLEISDTSGAVLRLSGHTGGVVGVTPYDIGSIEFKSDDASSGGQRVVATVKTEADTSSTIPGGELVFETCGASSSGSLAERMRIDSSGNLLVGTTDTSPHNNSGATSGGIALHSDSYLSVGRSSGAAMFINRQSNDGDIIDFRKDGTTVGSIGSYGAGGMYIGSGDVELAFRGDLDSIYPVNNLSGRDNAIDLGVSGARFNDLYLGGGVYLGGTGSANHLDDYEEGTFTPVLRDNTSGGNTATATVINGVYTKIGRLVHVDIYFVNINTSGMTSGNAAYITNLPFASFSGNNFSTGLPRIDQITVDGVGIAAEVAQGNSYIRLKQIISGAEDTNVIVGDFVSGYADFFLGLTYTAQT